MSLFGPIGKRRPRAMTMTEEAADAYLKSWRIFTISNEEADKKVVIRIKMTKPDHPDVDMLKTAVSISWPYQSESSMPSKQVNEQQIEFERSLDPLTSENDNSEIVQVTTGIGSKEWLFYAWSGDLFVERLNVLLSGQPAYPIKIEFYDDPTWDVWKDAVQRLSERAA